MRKKDFEAAIAAARAQGRGEALKERSYNGWTNYETWNVALWIDNDQGTQENWQQQAQRLLDEAEGDTAEEKREDAAGDLAKMLKDEIEDSNPLADQNSMYSDILSASLSDVDWYEIATNWLSDLESAEVETAECE